MSQEVTTIKKEALSLAQFEKLAEVPPELEWLANFTNEKTRRAYTIDVREFSPLCHDTPPGSL